MLDAARKAAGPLHRRESALLWVDLPTVLPPWDIPPEFLEPYFSDTTVPEEEEEPLLPWTGPVPLVVAPNDEATLLRLQRTYAAAVARLDTHLGVLFDGMRDKGWMQNWLIVLTAPYGLPLGDHGIVGFHRPWLHEELVHLPLLMCLPGGAEAGRRVAGLTQSVDVRATLLDALAHPSMHGRSLLPFCLGEMQSVRTEVFSTLRSDDAEEWALRTEGWSYLLPVSVPASDSPRSPQLYVKPDDRHEVNNVVQHHLELAEEMERKLRERPRNGMAES
jgi:arylsulfatase A-like enzyme